MCALCIEIIKLWKTFWWTAIINLKTKIMIWQMTQILRNTNTAKYARYKFSYKFTHCIFMVSFWNGMNDEAKSFFFIS